MLRLRYEKKRNLPRALLVVGDGPCRGELERAVAGAGLTRSVLFLGSRSDVCEILRNVDGVVSASVDEALPTALIWLPLILPGTDAHAGVVRHDNAVVHP